MIVGVLSTDDESYRASLAVRTFEMFSDARFLAILAYVISNERLIGRRKSSPDNSTSPQNYLRTKWISSSSRVASVLFAGELVFQLTSLGMGIRERVFDIFTLIELVFNSISYSALMVAVGCLPVVLGASIYLALATLISICTATAASSTKNVPEFLQSIALWISYWLGDFVYPTIDIFSVLASVSLNITPLIVYLSNIVVYLALALLILRKRGSPC